MSVSSLTSIYRCALPCLATGGSVAVTLNCHSHLQEHLNRPKGTLHESGSSEGSNCWQMQPLV